MHRYRDTSIVKQFIILRYSFIHFKAKFTVTCTYILYYRYFTVLKPERYQDYQLWPGQFWSIYNSTNYGVPLGPSRIFFGNYFFGKSRDLNSKVRRRKSESTKTKKRKYEDKNTKYWNTFKSIIIEFSSSCFRIFVIVVSCFRLRTYVFSCFRVMRLLYKKAMALTEHRKF